MAMASHIDDGIVAIDCEMVQIDSGKQVLAHVCAVGWDEAVLLNTYVDPGAPVKDYLTRYSGLRPGDLDGAPSFDSVQSRVAAHLQDTLRQLGTDSQAASAFDRDACTSPLYLPYISHPSAGGLRLRPRRVVRLALASARPVGQAHRQLRRPAPVPG